MITLEENLAKLDNLADQIEQDNITLEKSLEIFSQSIEVAEQCMKQLNDCKGKLTVLQKKMSKLADENDNNK